MKKNKKKFTRYTAFSVIVGLVFLAILSRLVFLQVIKGETYKEKANKKSVREVQDFAPRGNITDRKGVKLATSKQSYVLVYMETDESKEKFYSTMEKVFKILDENGEIQEDDFELKTNPFKFEFTSDNPKTLRTLELRFKKDRGLDKKVVNGYKDNLSDSELMKITPEQTFNMLLKLYKIDKTKYNVDQQRRLMIIKDAMKMQSFSGYKPVTIASNLKEKTAFIFLQKLSQLPGIDVNTQPIRYYPYGDFASSVLGYISKINTLQKSKYEEKGYDTSSDYVGASEIESVFEDRLRGSKGGRIVKINKQGRILEELGRRDPYPGQTIQLTIDKDVQYAAERAMDDTMKSLQKDPSGQGIGINTVNATRGAAVAIDVKTGKILALVSRPGFDPNIFTVSGNLNQQLLSQYFNPDLYAFAKSKGFTEEQINRFFPIDKSIKGNTTIRRDMYDLYPKTLYNYATESLIPPGSTFKPLTSVAALEEGVIDKDTIIQDKGIYTKNNFNKSCWIYKDGGGTHGYVNLVKALEVSCNYFFYEVGDRLLQKGQDVLSKYAWKFGLGVDPKSNQKAETGIEIPERFGQVYNTTSAKGIYSTLYMQQLNDYLKKGVDSRGHTFKAIDIIPSDSDTKDVSILKQNLKDSIIDQMKNKKYSYNNFYRKMKKDIQNYIQNVPATKKLNYSDSDISSIAMAIIYSIGDAHGEITTPGNTYLAAIGQGTSAFTPLQLANYVATLVNGGTRYKVHLVDKFLNPDGSLIEQVKPEVVEKVNLKASTVETIKEGMHEVISGEDGTGANAFKGFPIDNAGKTGSATFNEKLQGELGRTSYAVFTGFAPYDNPEIAVCVVIFDGGHGGAAAPVARAMYEAYFKNLLKSKYPNYVPEYNYTLKATK